MQVPRFTMAVTLLVEASCNKKCQTFTMATFFTDLTQMVLFTDILRLGSKVHPMRPKVTLSIFHTFTRVTLVFYSSTKVP